MSVSTSGKFRIKDGWKEGTKSRGSVTTFEQRRDQYIKGSQKWN